MNNLHHWIISALNQTGVTLNNALD